MNLRRYDSICLKVLMTAIVVVGFMSTILRFTITTEVVEYILMGLFVIIYNVLGVIHEN